MLHAALHDHNALAAIPPDSVGGFVYTGGPIPFTDIRGRGVRYVGPVGAKLQGWLRAKEAGRYELATDLSAHFQSNGNSPPTCLLHASLEDHSLGEHTVYVANARNNEAAATLVLAADLQPGLPSGLGPGAALHQGPEGRPQADQHPGRNGGHVRHVPGRLGPAALPGAGGRLLRMAGHGRREAAVRDRPAGRAADGLRRPMGRLARV